MNVTDKLMEEFVLAEEADREEIISGDRPLTTQQCEELKAHCTSHFDCASKLGMSWSFPCDVSRENPRDALVAVGSASGRVSIWW